MSRIFCWGNVGEEPFAGENRSKQERLAFRVIP